MACTGIQDRRAICNSIRGVRDSERPFGSTPIFTVPRSIDPDGR